MTFVFLCLADCTQYADLWVHPRCCSGTISFLVMTPSHLTFRALKSPCGKHDFS